jgi:ABC-type bacteriocin/lantibiotic exporter with double-glycine peptidase domain
MERKKRSTGSPVTGQSATNESTNRIASIAAEIVASRVFDWAITGVILGPLYWLYFVSFIVIGTFIIINLFISVIVRKSEEAYQQVQRESGIPLTQQEIMHEIREIRRILADLERRFEEKRGVDS